jgi:hypothetical protein
MQTMEEEPWFHSVLDRDEAELIANGIPKCCWGYILANGVPGTVENDGLGAIYAKRKHLVESISKAPNNKRMGVAVVDGRDLDTIRKWIGGCDWTTEEEMKWLWSVNNKS